MDYKPTLVWSAIKCIVASSLLIPLLLSDNTKSCSWTGSTLDGYYGCNALCYYDGNDHLCQFNGTSSYDSPTYCTAAHSSTYAEYLGNSQYTCSASVDGACFDYSFWIVLGLYTSQFLLHLLLAGLYPGFDPQQEMVDIALTFSINSDSITKLVHPFNCMVAIFDVTCLFYTFWSIDVSYVSCNGNYYSPSGTLRTLLMSLVMFMEWYGPVAVHALVVYRNETSACLPILCALVNWKLLLTCALLRAMQAFTSPVSILSWLSVQRQQRAAVGSKWLNMDVRDSFTMYALSSSADADADPNADVEGAGKNKWALLVRKLCSRYTVQYSFLKLLASVVVSLTLNADYMYCGQTGRSFTESQCPSDCSAHCIFAEQIDQENWSSRTHECDLTTTSCFCDNWVMTDCLAMVFNTVHFVLQCYYLIHYNNFDPQQSQIDCVQSYTFVGENITLFLTHPAICFLSVLEAAVLVVAWLAVVFSLGAVCPAGSGEHADVSNISSGLTFALLMTIIEIYKANMTVATNAWRERRYVWAACALLRVDLFVFYGSTLFLQTFLFPFSLMGYATNRMRRLAAGAGAGASSDNKSDCDNDGKESTMPVVRGSGSVTYHQVATNGAECNSNTSNMCESLLDEPTTSYDQM